MTKQNLFKLTSTALLIAIGILIPLTFPRVVMGPMSYTLASHVAIFISMFISPWVAIAVTIGTTTGFFMAGFLPVIVLRAASHLVFVIPFALYIQKAKQSTLRGVRLRILSLIIALVHAIAETATVIFFYLGTTFPDNQSIWWVLGFIGLGTIIHSVVDLEIANIIRTTLKRIFPTLIK